MIIDTDQLLSINQFSRIVNKAPQYIKHYIVTGRLEAIRLDRFFYIDKKELLNWPPKRNKIGRPPKHGGEEK